ncbi:hypothetical protein EV174_005847 [Coemansia sp. RSA 2320]|nr:hypothetical protein EV174_005847 [Coemansia sp. RSA 2320]
MADARDGDGDADDDLPSNEPKIPCFSSAILPVVALLDSDAAGVVVEVEDADEIAIGGGGGGGCRRRTTRLDVRRGSLPLLSFLAAEGEDDDDDDEKDASRRAK